MFYWDYPSERDIEYQIVERTSVFFSQQNTTTITVSSDETEAFITLIIINPDGKNVIVSPDIKNHPDWIDVETTEDTTYSNTNNIIERKFLIKISCGNDAPPVFRKQIVQSVLILNAYEENDQTAIIPCIVRINDVSEYLLANSIIFKNNDELAFVGFPTINSLVNFSLKTDKFFVGTEGNYVQYFTITEGDTKFYNNGIEYDTLQIVVSDITADNIDVVAANEWPDWVTLHPTIYHNEYNNPNDADESLYTTYISVNKPAPNVPNNQKISIDLVLTANNSIISNSRTITITISSIANIPPVWSSIIFNNYLSIDISKSNTIVLPSIVETEDCTFDVFASDQNNDNVIYTIDGTLPPGLEFNKGRITGTVSKFIYDEFSTDFNFTISATDGFDTISKIFYITVYNIGTDYYPHWVTSYGLLGSYISKTDVYIQLSAIDYLGRNIIFTLESGYLLPDGLTLSSNGVISGKTISYGVDTLFTFYVRIIPVGGYYDSIRQFSINMLSDSKIGTTIWSGNSFIEDLYEGIPSQLYIEASLIGGINNKIKYLITSSTNLYPSNNDFNIDERNFLPSGITTTVCGDKLLFIGKPNFGTAGAYSFNIFAFTQGPEDNMSVIGLSTYQTISFNVNKSYMNIYCNINIPIFGKDKIDMLKDLINNIPISNLYRVCDKNFGFNLYPSIFLISGLNINQNNIEQSFDNFGDNNREFTVLTNAIMVGYTKNYDYLYIPIIDKPSKTLKVNNKYIYSINNLRQDLINTTNYVNVSLPFEFLPDYMTTYTPMIVLCYLKSGSGDKILNQLKQLSYYKNLIGKTLIIDRYILELNQGDQNKTMTKYIKLPPGDY